MKRILSATQSSATYELAKIIDKIRYSYLHGRYVYGQIAEAVSTQSNDYVYGFISGLEAMGGIYNDSYYGVDELAWWIDKTPNWFNYLKSYVNSNR